MGALPLDDPSFLEELFAVTIRPYEDPLEALLYEEHLLLFQDFARTHFQESWSWYNTYLARALALRLINDSGEVDDTLLQKTLLLLGRARYSLGPERASHLHRTDHLLRALHLLSTMAAYRQALSRLRRPELHPSALQLIRDTLFLHESHKITDREARQAALAAWLTSLRQNVGSCFATAPAIMIQQEQPLRLLEDLSSLFLFGHLTRTYEGKAYSVPLSPYWGAGDLLKPVPLSLLGEDPLATLASAPGLQAAFLAIGLLKGTTPSEKKTNLEQLLRSHASWLLDHDPFSSLTARDLLKRVLLHVHGLTEETCTPPQEDLFGRRGLLLLPPAGGESAKERQRTTFWNQYEQAKKAFKGLTDNALLKAWEFTLASFAEAQSDCAKWNLYVSLGFSPEEPFGIGQSIQKYLQQQIDLLNEEITSCQGHYEQFYAQAKSVEGELQRGSSRETEWLLADYRLRRQEMDRVRVEQEAAYEKGQRLAHLFPLLVNFYGEKISSYFQEIYDAEMQDVQTSAYDDAPAGFRLLYKHGRTHAAAWSLIYNSQEYIQHLSAFFVAIENELRHLPEAEGLDRELSALITAILHTIQQPEFLENSFFRLARAYHEPLPSPLEREKAKRKPWAYLSGGTVGTLLSCYYSRAQPPTEQRRWVEEPNELLAFFIDTMKELPQEVQKLYQKEAHRSLLATSPTHAFLCKPGWKRFREAWESPLYTYTWIRDLWANPHQRFLDQNLLDTRMREHLLALLLQTIPPGYRTLAQQALRLPLSSLRANEFRASVRTALSYEKWLSPGFSNWLMERLDSLLYESMPLFPEYLLKERLHQLFDTLAARESSFDAPAVYRAIEKGEVGKYRLLSATDLRKIAKGLLLETLRETHSPVPWHQRITEVMQELQLSYPAPLLVADTNWVNQYFGFTVNPGTGALSFWKFDDCGSEGTPLTLWNCFLDGTDRRAWHLYSSPREYGQFG